MKNLAEFKRLLAEPNTTLTLIATDTEKQPAHKFINITRKIGKIQTNGVYLLDPITKKGSWLDYGKASSWKFVDDVATYQDEWTTLSYRVGKGE